MLIWLLATAGCGSSSVVADAGVGGGGGGGGDGSDADMSLVSVGDFATPPSTLTISPLSASLAFGYSQPFHANRPVTWSVFESGGGQIDTDGRYTAPSVAGIFHVHAVASDGTGDEIYATVTVTEHALTFIAGGYGNFGTVDGVGAAARFSSVRGMAWDGSRYLYFADAGAIRRLDTTTNAVTTIAGRARWWTGNVDDVGKDAKFGIPWSVALDGQGHLYVTDYSNDTLRQIDLATQRVTTVAGIAGTPGSNNGKGTAASFSTPTGLVFDHTNNLLYIGDANNGAIRIYDPSSTQVSTLTTSLAQPDGLAYDGKGTLYVVDVGSRQVLSVDTTSKVVTSIAGSQRGFRDGVGAEAHFDWPSQVTLEGGALYVGDTLALRKVDLASATVTSLPVRGGYARNVTTVLGDGQGHLFTGPFSDFSIRRLDLANGSDVVIAGPDSTGSGNVDGIGETARFSNPGQVTVSASGTGYVSDYDNAEVRAVDLSSTGVSTLVGTAWHLPDNDGAGRTALMYPTSVATDHAGTLFLVEAAAGTIRKWDTTTNTVTTLAGRANFFGIVDGVGSAARFNQPVAACVDGGALYVADQNNRTIRKVDIATGAVTTIAGVGEEQGAADGTGSAARFTAPSGIACDGAGHLYVSDRVAYAIRRIDLTANNKVDTPVGMLGVSGYVDMPGTAARFKSPGELTYSNGYLYLVDNGNTNLYVRKIKVGTSWEVSTIGSNAASDQQFYGIAVDGGGTVYVTNKLFASSGVYQVAADKSVSQVAGSTGVGNAMIIDGVGAKANFSGATGMTFDGNALYIADAVVVRKMDLTSGMVTTPVGFNSDSPNVEGMGRGAVLDQPLGLAFSDAKTLILADSSWIDSITVPGGSLSVTAGKVGYAGGADGIGTGASVRPAAMVSDGAGTIYFTGTHTVRRYVVSTGKVDTLAGQESVDGSMDGVKTAAQFSWPKGIAYDGSANLYVSDTSNNTIRKVVIATGEVTTLAGTAGQNGAVDGVGTAARFFTPVGIVHDGKGNLYVADSENGAIRKIEIATKKVTTYVGVLGEKGLQPGPLPAHLNAPQGVALLPDGGLVVTDEHAVVVVH